MTKDRFIADVNQIVENSITYNGPSSPYTQTAEHMRAIGLQKLKEVTHPSLPLTHTSSSLVMQDEKLLLKLEQRVNGVASPSPLLKLLEQAQPIADEMMLLEDLQHSSSSSSSESESDMEQN